MQMPLSKEVLAFALTREMQRTLVDAEKSGIVPFPYHIANYIASLGRCIYALEGPETRQTPWDEIEEEE